MSDGEVHYVRDGQVATVIFDRPAARNAMTWRMYEQLGEACARIGRDGGVRVAVLRGAGGKAFIAGTDIAQFQAFRSAEDGIAYEAKMEGYLAGLEALPVPTLAVVEGFAIGGGLAIAACCDLRIGTPGARFGVPIARTLGNCLSMANYARLAALIGPQRTKEVIFLAKLIDGPTALGIGLVSELLPDAASLHARAEEVARTVANHAPITLQVTKEALRRLQARLGDDNIDDLIRLAYGSQDFREGMAAFLAKRAPKWSGT
jgi:enoyl-CoA hydratase